MRLFLICCLVLTPVCNLQADQQPSPDEALAKAIEYLRSQQKEDGSWRSEQYAVLRGGQALTPFVLLTLLESQTILSSDDFGRARRAEDFIVAHLDESGCLGKSDSDILEYPVYSSSYALLALARLGQFHKGLGPGGEERIAQEIALLGSFLRKAQFDQADGFEPDTPAFGGWGFDAARAPGDPGHMDLAHTRRALQALRSWGKKNPAEDDGLCFLQAERFLRVVQKLGPNDFQPYSCFIRIPEPPFDGGFFFSPVVPAANKGRKHTGIDGTESYRSYATATCDGILALLAAGVPIYDERVQTAATWLKEHSNLDYPQGIPTDHPEPWGAAERFYHYAVRAEVYDALDFPALEKRALARAVAHWQNADGSFVNHDSPLMKEDEPLLATTLAAIALIHTM